MSASHEVLNEFREYERTSTAAVDAYVTPVLTERRRYQPRGTAGGAPGACGENIADGEPLPSKATEQMEAGTTITIRTPGGGGYGEPANRAADTIETDRRDEKVTSSHRINPSTGEVPPRTDDADDSETSS